MNTPFDETYTGQLRKAVGQRKLIMPGVRAVITDEQGRVLLIHRRDTGRWGMPAGAMELEESVFSALKREVAEETGLTVQAATPIAFYSDPRYSFQYPNGDQVQVFALVFRVDKWDGELKGETDETRDARFFPLDALPDLHEVYAETLEDLRNYAGKLIVK